MPRVGEEDFPYTDEGIEEAQEVSKETGLPVEGMDNNIKTSDASQRKTNYGVQGAPGDMNFGVNPSTPRMYEEGGKVEKYPKGGKVKKLKEEKYSATLGKGGFKAETERMKAIKAHNKKVKAERKRKAALKALKKISGEGWKSQRTRPEETIRRKIQRQKDIGRKKPSGPRTRKGFK